MRRYDVDLIINCYENTYRKVLNAGFIKNIIEKNRFSFKNVFIVIGNVNNRKMSEELAGKIVKEGILNAFYFVEDHIDAVLKKVGLKKKELGRIYYYSDWAFVALAVCRSPYLLHWDADVELTVPGDWITPSLDEMKENPSVITANPMWSDRPEKIKAESFDENSDFYYGYGFSDQLYLINKELFLKPVYHYIHPYTLRYPLYCIAPIFESRVDSFMRRTKKYRLTYKHAVYSHPVLSEEESSHPMDFTFIERMRKFLYNGIFKIYKSFFIKKNTLK